MTRKSTAAVLTAVAAAACAPAALADTCATLAVSSPATITDWNPLLSLTGPKEASFSVTLTRIANSSKSVRLIFLDNQSDDPGRIDLAGPRYQVLDGGGNIVSFPAGTQVVSQTGVPTINFGNGANDSVTVAMKVRLPANGSPSPNFAGGAPFEETLNYSLQCFKANGRDDGIEPAKLSTLKVRAAIQKLANFTTASAVNMNFQNFTALIDTAMIKVESTAMLNLTAVTTNGGRLLRANAPANPPQNLVIPYTIKFGGNTLTPGQTAVTQLNGGVVGTNFPLELSLGATAPSGKLAGAYADTITLTVTPGQ